MRTTITQLKQMKERGERIAMVTAYDYPTARFLDEAGVPVILVGDSLGMVVLGYDSTLPVTMEVMLHHVKAVMRGAQHAMVIGDMPFMSYQVDSSEALHNAGRFLQEAGAQAVKIEGGAGVAPTVRRLVDAGIPVMAHIGLTPQSVHQMGGYKVQGRDEAAAAQLLRDAQAMEDAGAFSIVLECIPAPLARAITKQVKVPTIGIGAGPDCDGQVQVFHDMVAFYPERKPKHAKQYAKVGDIVKEAARRYIDDVRDGAFPTQQESYSMDEAVLAAVYGEAKPGSSG